MPAARLLAEFHRLHDLRDWAGVAALFASDGELRFHVPAACARGASAIERLLRDRDLDGLVIGEPGAQEHGGLAATYGWRSAPDAVAGELRMHPTGDRIGRLDLHALPGGPRVPRDRVSVRAVLVAPGPVVLLFRCAEPGKDGGWWITPGGGRDPGEDDLAALRREVREEVGIRVERLGPCLWTRTHTFVWRDDVLRQHERFYLVRVPAVVEPAPTEVDDGTVGHRWWTLEALAATDETLVPRRLAALVRSVLRHGPPAAPFDAGP